MRHSTAALVGIIGGSGAGLLLVALVLLVTMRRRKPKDSDGYNCNSAVSMASTDTKQPPLGGNGSPPGKLFIGSSNANPIYTNQSTSPKPTLPTHTPPSTTATATPTDAPTPTVKVMQRTATMQSGCAMPASLSPSRQASKEGPFSRTATHPQSLYSNGEPLYDNFDCMAAGIVPQQPNPNLVSAPSYHAEIPTPSPLTLQSFTEHLFFGNMTSHKSQGIDVTEANKVEEIQRRKSTLIRPTSAGSNDSIIYINLGIGEDGGAPGQRRSSYMSRDRFVKLRQLGESEKSAVFQGVLQDGGQFANIAIKELKMTTTVDARTFRAEAKTLIELRHPNLVAILGCTDTQPLSLVMEYAALGDLGSYLRDRKAERSKVTLAERLWYAYQMARGMAYLAHRGIVHPDLRAKNCLLSEPTSYSYGYPVVKIAGFGLSQCSAPDEEVYLMKSKGKMPFAWMGPEALKSLQMTMESNVWAYGVALWEIFSDGGRPYAGSYGSVESWVNLINDLDSGYRLPKPKSCDSDTHRLMLDCWEADPTKRPTFQMVATRAADTFIPHCPVNVIKQVTEDDVRLVDLMDSSHPTSPLSQAPSGYAFTVPNTHTTPTPAAQQNVNGAIYENLNTVVTAKLA